jgi:hypothetical protein
LYKKRCCRNERGKAAWANAAARRIGLTRLLVRGKATARTVLLWVALAPNMLRLFALRRAAAHAVARGESRMGLRRPPPQSMPACSQR